VSIDNIARIAKGLHVEPWQAGGKLAAVLEPAELLRLPRGTEQMKYTPLHLLNGL
jgi:hypothetical protein